MKSVFFCIFALLFVFESLQVNGPTICGSNTVTSVLDNDEHSFDVVFNPQMNEFLVVYIERTTSNGKLQNNIYAQRLSESEKVGSPVLISDEAGDKKFVTVGYNEKDNTYLVVWTFQTPPTTDWDIKTRQLNGTAFPLTQANYLTGSIYNEQAPSIVYAPKNNQYLITLEIQGTNQYIWMAVVGSSGNQQLSPVIIGGGTLNDPKNISRPDIAHNKNTNDFMMVLEYDRMSDHNHDIISLHLYENGSPDLRNYYDVATFETSNGLESNEKEPTVAYNNNTYMCMYEFVPNPDAATPLTKLAVRELSTVGQVMGNNFTVLNTSQPNASYGRLMYNDLWHYGATCETFTRNGTYSDIDLSFITLDNPPRQAYSMTIPGKHTDDSPVLTYNADDLRWLLAWASHSPNAKRNIARSRPVQQVQEKRKAQKTEKQEKAKLFIVDSDHVAYKQKEHLPVVPHHQQNEKESHQFEERSFPGETAILKIGVICVEQDQPTGGTHQVSNKADMSGYITTLIVVIGIVVLIGILSSIAFFYFRRRVSQGKGIPKPFVKYVSLSTNDEEHQ